ncbi:MAG TPA: XdhC family protein [Gemmatimonadaceae bacterium]|nr:XdhC family protein [Gemmatimonadaceae bacterium]
MTDDTLLHLAQLRDAGERRVAVATLVATRGASPKKEGACMWVGEGGRVLGAVTIGGCVDARVLEASETMLREPATAVPRLLTVELGEDDAYALGMTCGGAVDVLVETLDLGRGADPATAAYGTIGGAAARGRRSATVTPLSGPASGGRFAIAEDAASASPSFGEATLDAAAERLARAALDGLRAGVIVAFGGGEAFVELHVPAPTLLVFGAGSVAAPLVALAAELGWRTVVVDGRERFATRERFPRATELRVGIPSEIAAGFAYGAATSVVLVAHDYKYDVPVLREVLRHDAAYVGLLGSRRRGRAILDFLADEGVDAASLERVRVPVGLDIGARTAGEIAVAVLAEAIAARSGRPGTPLRATLPPRSVARSEEAAR